jgi:hypothetical protein
MIITMLVVGGKMVLAFFVALVLAMNVQYMVGTLKEEYPSIDPHSWALVFWTLCFTMDLPGLGLTFVPTMIGFIPVARAHCRVAGNHRPRNQVLRIVFESFRNAAAPYRTIKAVLVGKCNA